MLFAPAPHREEHHGIAGPDSIPHLLATDAPGQIETRPLLIEERRVITHVIRLLAALQRTSQGTVGFAAGIILVARMR